MTFILGFGAMVLVGPAGHQCVDAGGNMAAPLLAELLGGTPFLGFIAAVAFATILAVVAGLTLSGAAALSHDLWASVVRREKPGAAKQLRVARMATIGLGILAVPWGSLQGSERGVHGGTGLCHRRERQLPRPGAVIFWRRSTTAGTVPACCSARRARSPLIFLSPTVQVDILKHPEAWFPLRNPRWSPCRFLFAAGILVSLLAPRPDEAAGFDAVSRRMHPRRDRSNAVPFSTLKLHPSLHKGIKELGFTRPTPIQADAIPPAMEGRDVLACAMTGSGKTAAFLLPILHRLIDRPRGTTRALVLAPTRELAAQILEDLNDLAVHTPITRRVGLRRCRHGPAGACFPQWRGYDDRDARTAARSLAAPYAKLGGLEYLVLDEADRMLDMGFLPDIRRILRHIPGQAADAVLQRDDAAGDRRRSPRKC